MIQFNIFIEIQDSAIAQTIQQLDNINLTNDYKKANLVIIDKDIDFFQNTKIPMIYFGSGIPKYTYIEYSNNINDLIFKINQYKKIFFYDEDIKNLKEEVTNLHHLFDIGNIVVFKWRNDSNWSIEYVSKNVEKILGYCVDDFLSSNIFYTNLIHKDDISKVKNEINIAIEKNLSNFIHEKYRLHTKNNKIIVVNDNTHIIKNEKGEITHFLGYITDITKEQNLEKELDDITSRYTLAIDSTKDGLWDWDMSTNNVYFSKKWKEMLGYENDNLAFSIDTWKKIVHPDDMPNILEAINNHLEHKSEYYECENRLLCKDGTYKWILGRGKALFDLDGNPYRMIGFNTDITATKELQQKLINLNLTITEYNQKLEKAHAIAHLGYFNYYPKKDKIYFSKEAIKIFDISYTQNDINILFENIENGDKKIFKDDFFDSIKNKSLYKRVHKIVKDTKVSYLQIEAEHKYNAIDNHTETIGTILDITDNKMLENKIIEAKKFNEAIINNAKSIIAVFDKNNAMVKINKFGLDFLQYDTKEIYDIPKLWVKVLPAYLKEDGLNLINNKDAKIKDRFQAPWINKYGEEMIFEWSNTIIYDEDDSLKYILSIGIDVTEKNRIFKELKNAKNQIEQRAKKFATMFNNHNSIMLLVNPEDGSIIDANKSASIFYGYSIDELKMMKISDINIQTQDEIKQEMNMATISNRNYFVFEHKIKCGKIRTVEVHSSPLEIDDKVLLFSIIHDITDKAKHERENYRLYQEQKAIFDNMSFIGIRTDKNGLITAFNKQAQNILEYTEEEIIYRQTPILVHDRDEMFTRKYEFEKELNIEIKSLFDVFVIKTKMGLKNEYEWTYISKTGKKIPVLLNVSAIKDKNKEITDYIGIAKDITVEKKVKDEMQRLNDNLKQEVQTKLNDIRQKEQMLIQQSKMASMGEMIGSIAHQWRQPLNALSIIKDVLIDDFYDNSLDEKKISDFEKKSNNLISYMSKTIDDFRNFFIPSKEKQRFNLVKEIDSIKDILTAQLNNYNIDLTISSNSNQIDMISYPNEFKQVLLNIINNSKDAITKKGIKGEILLHISDENDKIYICIKDNGGGIPNDIIDKIFEPYFTTKFEAQGTGLGLYMAKTIIENSMSGKLIARNVDNGALFEIIFNKGQR